MFMAHDSQTMLNFIFHQIIEKSVNFLLTLLYNCGKMEYTVL